MAGPPLGGGPATTVRLRRPPLSLSAQALVRSPTQEGVKSVSDIGRVLAAANSRNGTRSKTVGPVELTVPRDRDGQVANRPLYVALAVTVDGTRDVLGLWAGDGGEGAECAWSSVTGSSLPDSISVPLCGPPGLGQDLPRAQALLHGSDSECGGGPVPGVPGGMARQVPGDCAALGERLGAAHALPTNAIESVNARIRKAVRARGHFPNEAAALRCVYLAIMSLDPAGQGRKRWTMRWKPALQAFGIAFGGRLSAGRR
ncbi:hypothetical protein GCM10018780_29940 [Streptomyces lanatus]|nr:hypothetical protein GCM10018780_29940 [Streptomyces lanatus]